MKTIQAAILSIGTELTTGQITNTNASWIGQQLAVLGISTSHHISVPDHKKLILGALQFLAQQNIDLLFVTGGLGPTSDDFTRDVLAEWSNKELQYDESSWQHLQKQLSKKNVKLTTGHKQECFFPEGSVIWQNNMGTANAFGFEHQNMLAVILPGPPRELQVLWTESIVPFLHSRLPSFDRELIFSSVTTGFPESVVAQAVEDVTKNCPFVIGYRAHFPTVEVKLHYRESLQTEAQLWILKIEAALKTLVK